VSEGDEGLSGLLEAVALELGDAPVERGEGVGLGAELDEALIEGDDLGPELAVGLGEAFEVVELGAAARGAEEDVAVDVEGLSEVAEALLDEGGHLALGAVALFEAGGAGGVVGEDGEEAAPEVGELGEAVELFEGLWVEGVELVDEDEAVKGERGAAQVALQDLCVGAQARDAGLRVGVEVYEAVADADEVFVSVKFQIEGFEAFEGVAVGGVEGEGLFEGGGGGAGVADLVMEDLGEAEEEGEAALAVRGEVGEELEGGGGLSPVAAGGVEVEEALEGGGVAGVLFDEVFEGGGAAVDVIEVVEAALGELGEEGAAS
jgi:hypothetical protein